MSLIEKGVYFLLFIYLARYSEAKEYGSILSAFAFANILQAFFEFGFGAYIQREASSIPNITKIQLNSIVLFKIAVFFVFCLFTFLYYTISQSVITNHVYFITAIIYLAGFSSLFSKYLYGLNLYEESFYALLKSRMVIPVGLAIVIFFQLSSYVIFIFFLSGISVQTFLLYHYIQTNGDKLLLQFDKKILSTVLKSSFPMGIGVAFVWMYDKLDILLIHHIMGTETVAFYSVAYSLYKLPIILSGVILTPLYTDLSEKFSIQKEINLYDLRRPIQGLLLISTCILIIYNSFSGILLEVIYGKQYAQSSWMLGLLAFALPALYLNNFTGVTLNAVRKERKAMQSALWALLINIGLNIVLLPTIGIIGAVIATICAEYSIFFIQCYFLKQSNSIIFEK